MKDTGCMFTLRICFCWMLWGFGAAVFFALVYFIAMCLDND